MRAAIPLLVLLTLAAGAVLLRIDRDRGESQPVQATLSAVAALAGGDTAGFARAVEPRAFVFPRDHGPHPEYRTEWWYVTGNVESRSGDPFGFQLTFFRSSLAPTPAGRDSAWDTNQLWMAHFALTDVAGGRHVAGERFARGAVGMAGAEASPFRVWLGDWELRGEDGEAFPMLLRARDGDIRVELRLEPMKPPVPQGDQGLSTKGPEPGNASYYLSWTRLDVQGEMAIGDRGYTVEGRGWMDREWSTSALGDAHVGWDWFALQLDDGRELVFFELRRRDKATDPLNHGALVESDGTYRMIGADELEVEILDWWASPLDGTRYPSGWRIRIPDEALDLEVVPRLRDQEMKLSFRYWEGAVLVRGRSGGDPVEGLGYVELTGYGEH